MVRWSHLRSEIIWVLVGQALAFSGGFIGIKVLTSILGPAGYGQLALGVTIAGLLHMFVYGPIEQVILRFVSVCSERRELDALFSLIKSTHRFLGMLLLIFILCVTLLTSAMVGKEWAALVASASLFGIVSGLNATFSSIHSALRQRKIVALHQGADVWLRLGLAIIALLLYRNTGYVALLGFLCGTLLIAVSQQIFALRDPLICANWVGVKGDKGEYRKLRQEIFDYGKPFILFALFGTVSAYADRWIILGFSGEVAVGGYAAMYQLANAPIALFVGITNQLVVPVIFERAGALDNVSQVDNSARLLDQTFLIYSGALLAITGIAYVFGEQLVSFITTPEFVPYHSLLWILTLGLALSNIGQLLVMKGLSHKQTRGYIAPKLLQTVTFLVLASVLLRVAGPAGVAWALCLSSLIYLTTVIAVNHRMSFIH